MNLKIALSIFSFFLVSALHATPREHVQCPVIDKITEPENSAGFRMSEDCSTAYVLPPTVGEIRVSPVMVPDSSSTCTAVMGSVEALSRQSQSLNAIVKQKADLLLAIANDRAACASVRAQNDAVDQRMTTQTNDLSKAQADLQAAQSVQDKCKADSSPSICDSIDDKVDRLQDRISNLNDRLSEAQDSHDAVVERLSVCEARHPHSKDDNALDTKELGNLTTQIATTSKDVTNERKRLMALPGGEASLTFMSEHANLVQAYHQLNSGLGVQFVQMPLKKASIHFELVHDGKAAGLASVSRFKIFGADPTKPNVDQSAEDGVDVNGAKDAERLFGGAVGAQISLNLYAACNLRQNFADLSSDQARQWVANLIRPTVTYEYELQVTKDIKINYNESYLYQSIKQHTTHGGLFWSSSSESITEDREASKWLTIVEDSEDSDQSWAQPEKILFDLRREVLDSALGRLAKKTYTTPDEALADGGTPPEDGAKVASKNLRQYPNVYCQVAAIALDIGDALFGGSSSQGTTTRTMNTSDIQNLVINGMVKFAGTQTFEPAGN